ncbi:ABC transporter substrate-binding protein [Vibrio sp. S4M6]|uniref:ABC transporter substrate-binding protein n=1 Tax=Vibrio sinus TaxID=2946865 RepID=UPI00202A495C|nr:ABC transporter substrate-binding protein [Vibrio sinus]MCL9783158.1 ABC transporter substrate-binding protein [Vibrio sinus]
MKLNKWISALLSFIIFIVPVANAQQATSNQPEKKHVVMLLWRGVTNAEKGFMDYLSARVNVEFIILNADRNKDKLKEYIRTIDSYHPDLIYTFGTTISRELLGTYEHPSKFEQTHDIPVVFNVVTDPVGSKLIPKTGERHRDFTGVSHIVPLPVQFKAISQLKGVRSIGIIYNPLEHNSILTAKKMMALASQFKMNVYLYPLGLIKNQPNLGSLDHIVTKMKENHIDLAYLPPDSYIIANGKAVVQKLQSANIPTFSATETPIRKYDALFGVVSRYYNAGQFAAYKAEQILDNKRNVSKIPIDSLSQYSYIVNMEAAKQLDYYPPVSILKISELVGNKN